MWDDIVIGETKLDRKFNSSIRIFKDGIETIKEDISENAESYWISECFLDVGMTIYKDTLEGGKIKVLIEDGAWEQLSELLDTIVLRKLPVRILKEKIDDYGDKRFSDGKNKIQGEFCKLMGI